MMIICINCKPETKRKLDSLLRSGQYEDYSELISASVDYLWMLEQEIGAKGALVIGESSKPTLLQEGAISAQKTESKGSDQIRSARNPKASRGKTAAVETSTEPTYISDVFSFNGLDDLSVITTEISGPLEEEKDYTLDRWIFCQYNKLLPAKASCRALCRMASDHPEGISMEEAARQISEQAALLGDYLAEHDNRHQIGRDESLATAFPKSGPKGDKGRFRYANHFVGSVSGQGVFHGLLAKYRLAGLLKEKRSNILPTDAAARFARMRNPVLDECQADPKQKFSEEEQRFLLDHIREQVPVEIYAFRTIIKAITEGANTPDNLDEALKGHVPADSEHSQSFITSQRSGALSRMADLGLIIRERNGVRVSYSVTEKGQRLIESKQPFREGGERS